MEDARARILGYEDAPISAVGGHGGNSWGDLPTTYPDGDDADVEDFADVPISFNVDVRGWLNQEFDAIGKLCHTTKAAVPDNENGVFSLAWQNLNAVLLHYFAIAARMTLLEHVCVDEETEAT